MATVGLAITNLLQTAGQTPAQLDVQLGPRANATPAQGPNDQHDIVTLTGQTGESQQSSSGNGSTQFAEAAAFFFAESQTFKAANGSGGNQTAKLPDVPQLPVKTTQEPDVGDAQPAADGEQPTTGGIAESALTSGISFSSSSISTSSPSDTPLAELAQLDATLQQMNINPQSISLFNRMAMLLYANDPAALRVLIQTLQLGTEQLGASGSDADTEASQRTQQAVLKPLLPGQLQVPEDPQPQSASPVSQQPPAISYGEVAVTPSDSGSTSPQVQGGVGSNQGNPQTALTAQFGELQSIFTLGGANGASSTSAGKVLDVTA